MMVKMTRDQWDIDITRFADRLSVIERFQDGELAGMFLNLPSDGVKVAGSNMATESGPSRKCGGGGGNRSIYLSLAALGNCRYRLAIARIDTFKCLRVWRVLKTASNEWMKPILMFF
jgi:hypothetical protein